MLLTAALCANRLAPAASNDLPFDNFPINFCGLSERDPSRWNPSRRLGEAAKRWARGTKLNEAVLRSGYTAKAISALHLTGIDAPNKPPLGVSTCRVLRDRSLVDIGKFEQRNEVWIVFASPVTLPIPGDEADVAQHALDLVNRARQVPQHCGTRIAPSVMPLRMSETLSKVAHQHAQDMADHHYFDHIDPRGRTPADRVRAAGYPERLVGENIALGTLSTADAIAGWLMSPEHCENIMDPRFKEMGIAYAQKRGGRGELYWVQVLARPP